MSKEDLEQEHNMIECILPSARPQTHAELSMKYAEKIAVEFAEFIRNHPLQFQTDSYGTWIGLDFKNYTTAQLYQLFLQSKTKH